jgi:hypothetical protein
MTHAHLVSALFAAVLTAALVAFPGHADIILHLASHDVLHPCLKGVRHLGRLATARRLYYCK